MPKNSRGKLSGAVRNLILQCAKSEASYLGIILSERGDDCPWLFNTL